MSTIPMKVVSTGLFLLFIFLSGFWLSNAGRPINAIILAVHKLIGLAAGIFLVVNLYRVHQVSPFGALEIGVIVITALFFLSNVVTGGLLSTDKVMPAFVQRLHQITPYLTVLSTAVTMYFLLKHQ